MTYLCIKFVGDSSKIEPKDIPILSDMSQEPTPEAVNLFEDICGRVFKKTNLDKFIAKIVNAKRKAHHEEMLFYLRTLHYAALPEIQDAYIDHGLAPDSERLKKFSPVFKAAHKISDLMQQVEDEKVLDVGFEISSRMMAEQLIFHKYNARSEVSKYIRTQSTAINFRLPQSLSGTTRTSSLPRLVCCLFHEGFSKFVRMGSLWRSSQRRMLDF